MSSLEGSPEPEAEALISGPERYPTFEEQFAKREIIEILGAKIEVVDIKPEVLETETPISFSVSLKNSMMCELSKAGLTRTCFNSNNMPFRLV